MTVSSRICPPLRRAWICRNKCRAHWRNTLSSSGKQAAEPSFGEGILSSTIEDLTVNFEENGTLVCKEIDKEILSKGAWTTILFRYQEWQTDTSDYGPDKYVIRRYKKSGGEYRMQSKFTISSAKQAQKIVDVLQGWGEEAKAAN